MGRDRAARVDLTAPKAGMYRAEFQVEWVPSGTGLRDVWFEINTSSGNSGNSGDRGQYADTVAQGLAGGTATCNASMTVRLNQGDTVRLACAQTSGGTLAIYSDAVTPTCFALIYTGA